MAGVALFSKTLVFSLYNKEGQRNIPISISRSKRPGRRRAGSMAFGRFVVATTKTRASVSSTPSISVSSVATTRFSTSPPASSTRRGHIASTSSSMMIHGARARAAAKTRRRLASVSPWYAEVNSGPLTVRTDEPVEAEIARARCVFPVPEGPWRSNPRGGLRSTRRQAQVGYPCQAFIGTHESGGTGRGAGKGFR